MSWLAFNSAQPLLVVLEHLLDALQDRAGAGLEAPQPVGDLPKRGDTRAAESDQGNDSRWIHGKTSALPQNSEAPRQNQSNSPCLAEWVKSQLSQGELSHLGPVQPIIRPRRQSDGAQLYSILPHHLGRDSCFT